ncbi:MAG: helix-turn-helix domain-containing protein [Desulfovibrio sp.]|nr:helix-turn-helix domain-containing protein [Desulfovibrio sp.]
MPRASEIAAMRRFSGCCRFLWNKELGLERRRARAKEVASSSTKWRVLCESGGCREIRF